MKPFGALNAHYFWLVGLLAAPCCLLANTARASDVFEPDLYEEIPFYNSAYYQPISINDSVELVRTRLLGSTGYFFNVIREQRRVWKSPMIYFDCAGATTRAGDFGGALTLRDDDLDGDGVNDYLSLAGTGRDCEQFSFFASLRGGSENLLVRFERQPHESIATKPILDSDHPLPDDLWKKIGAYLGKHVPAQNKKTVDEIIAQKRYGIMPPPSQDFDDLKKLHSSAVRLHRQKQYATDALDQFFASHDFRAIDPQNVYPEYTEMLNDFAFFIWVEYRRMKAADEKQLEERDSSSLVQNIDASYRWAKERTSELLRYVLARDPTRVAAYLNFADVLYEEPFVGVSNPDDKKQAAEYYTTYHDLMLKAGKEDKIPARVFERMK